MRSVFALETLVTALLALGSVKVAQASTLEFGPPGSRVSTADTTVIDEMNVDIWPEYDDPRVLVIYRGNLQPGITVPRDFTLVIPTGAEIHMAGAIDDRGGHVHARYSALDRGDGMTEIAYSLPTPNFYMEFYYDPLGDADVRDFSYTVVSPLPISQLVVSVQRPRRADGFQVTPATTELVQDDRGLAYHIVRMGGIAAGEARTVSIRYEKGDREPSVEAGITPEPGTADRGVPVNSLLKLSALLLLAVVVYAARSVLHARAELRADAGLRTSDPNDHPAAMAEPHRLDESRFCTGCGSRIEPGDRFCAMCGHPVRPRSNAT